MGKVITRAVPGDYEVEVRLELEDGTLTDWQWGRATVDDAHRIRLVSHHDWDILVSRTTAISAYQIRGLTFTVPLIGSNFVSPPKGRRPDTVTLAP